MKMTDVRAWIAFILIAAFLFAYFVDPTPEMKGALITAFTGAVAYYLGSSKGAHENREELNRIAARSAGKDSA